MCQALPKAGEMTRPAPLLQGDTAVCATVATDDPTGRMIMLEDLAALYLKGARRMLLVCLAEPPEGAWAIDSEVVAQFNDLLTSRGFDPMAIKRAGIDSKAATRLRAHAEETTRISSRRRVFPGIAVSPEEDTEGPALARLQAMGIDQDDTLFAAAPMIDAATCTGCDACIRACPTDVLTHINDRISGASYAVEPAGCDACGLCVGLCTFSAISLEYMTRRPNQIALTSWTCAACGVPVHAPAESAGGDGLCEICRQTGHHKKLYQVLP
jgi:ferredoxin